MLTRKQRAKITTYCLKKLYPECVKRQNLFTDMDAADLVEELGVHIWVALIRYRRKPYDQALKLAIATGVNRLKSIVRSRMTVVKRGAKAQIVPLTSGEKHDEESGGATESYWLYDRGLYSNGIRVIDALELICSAAILRVGVKRADALVKALAYDWRKSKVTKPQKELMHTLNRDRKSVRDLVASFTRAVRRELGPDEALSYQIQKIEGRWKNPLE